MVLKDYIDLTLIDLDPREMIIDIQVLYLDEPLETLHCSVDRLTHKIVIDDVYDYEQYLNYKVLGQLLYNNGHTLIVTIEEPN